MKVIKFTKGYEPVLSIENADFKTKYEERVGDNSNYQANINGDVKHLALCPKCDNPVVILGIYKKISVAPHARHCQGISIAGVSEYDEYKLLQCPYYRKNASYVKEYVPETEEPQRQELYRIAKENFDKAIYLIQKKTGIYITINMAEALAENYARLRVYNYIDATLYNIPWYLMYGFNGFPLYHMIIKKHTTLYRHLKNLGIEMKDSKVDGHVYVETNEGYIIRATNYRYIVDKNENLNEWLDFSILRPDEDVRQALLYNLADSFSISVDSYYFGNLVDYSKWKCRQNILDIADRFMDV